MKDFHFLPTRWRSGATYISRDQMVLDTRVNRCVIFVISSFHAGTWIL